ncbi:helix-turn-helix domain-containing protein [Microbacterium immunditiarum]|uniref:Excisionase family DNA binding protein n=1 Tax=Microbacterium immunditiarum TaxID=337480 RepID=A0A7Y9GN66_9MICO|nr:helix-turn-helix domain-containing protein [Microbacterium immunditiarum]NYE19467.1 excisionase family DNA binding protein [Microbacterium immunditiarum]
MPKTTEEPLATEVPKMTEEPLALTYKEAAALIGVDSRRISEAVESGVIPSVQIGARRMIPRAALLKIFAVEVAA